MCMELKLGKRLGSIDGIRHLVFDEAGRMLGALESRRGVWRFGVWTLRGGLSADWHDDTYRTRKDALAALSDYWEAKQ